MSSQHAVSHEFAEQLATNNEINYAKGSEIFRFIETEELTKKQYNYLCWSSTNITSNLIPNVLIRHRKCDDASWYLRKIPAEPFSSFFSAVPHNKKLTWRLWKLRTLSQWGHFGAAEEFPRESILRFCTIDHIWMECKINYIK